MNIRRYKVSTGFFFLLTVLWPLKLIVNRGAASSHNSFPTMCSDDTTIWNLWLRYGRYLNVSFRILQKGADSDWERRCIRRLEIVISEEHQIHFITYNILACNWAFVNDFYTSLLFECTYKSLPPIAALWESIVPCTSRGKLLHTTTPLTFIPSTLIASNELSNTSPSRRETQLSFSVRQRIFDKLNFFTFHQKVFYPLLTDKLAA